MQNNKKYTEKIINILSKYPEISLGILFGSAVKGRLTEKSDIDIAIASDRPIDHDRLIDIAVDCELSLGRRVDIVDLQSVTGIILKQALCNGQILFKKSALLLAGLLKKMWYNQADMMPYTKMMMNRQVEKFIYE